MNNAINPIPEDSLLGKILAEVANGPRSAVSIAERIEGVTKSEVNGVMYAARAFFLKSGWSPLCVRGVSQHNENIKLWGVPAAGQAAADEDDAEAYADPEE